MDADLCPHLDDAGRDLDQPQSQRIELGEAPSGALRHDAAQPPQKPVGSAVKEQAELVGDGPGAGGAVGSQMGLPGLDVVLGRAAPAVDLLVESLGAAEEISDDEARVGALMACLHAGNDALVRLQLAAPS